MLNYLSADFLSKLLPVLLVVMALYFLFSKQLSDKQRLAKMSLFGFASVVVPLIAFYDGFFGAGAGTFYLLAVVSLLGMATAKAMAYSRMLNFASSIISLGIFIYLGKMAWLAGSLMAIGEMAGVYLGSSLVVKNGAKLVRPLVVIVCILMAIKLFFA